jgi:hypothetical protein
LVLLEDGYAPVRNRRGAPEWFSWVRYQHYYRLYVAGGGPQFCRWGIGREAIPGVAFDVTIEIPIGMLFVVTFGCSTGWPIGGSTGQTIERTIG